MTEHCRHATIVVVSFEVGQTVGNYRILEKLGAGGMGEVFLAEHPLIGKSVALKVIHQDMAANRELVARFVNEAKAVSTVGNDHIVEVHDFGVTDVGAHFFIMEHLAGKTLGDAMSDGTLVVGSEGHVDACLHIAAQVADGLGAAHRHNIIHRDLKPDNIMLIHKLGDPHFVKILDFGLAKMLESEAKLTASGVVLGTPEFMSPEAAESKDDIDGRSDIYSCGVLLYLMLTGRLPFEASSMGEMMVQHVVKAPPAPRGFNPNISPAVEQIVLRCLAKKREDRFASMEELRTALLDSEGYLRGAPKMMHSDGSPETFDSGHPAMARPKGAAPRTMHIGTPAGFVRASRHRSAIVAFVALLSAGGGVAAALSQDKSSQDRSVQRLASSQASETVVLSGEPSVAPETPNKPEPPAYAATRITSKPSGALVVDETGAKVGTTPFVYRAARGQEVSWQFRMPGHSPLRYRFTPGDEPVEVTLIAEGSAKVEKRPRPAVKRPKKRPPRVENDLLKPEL